MKKWESFSHRERQELAARAREPRRPAGSRSRHRSRLSSETVDQLLTATDTDSSVTAAAPATTADPVVMAAPITAAATDSAEQLPKVQRPSPGRVVLFVLLLALIAASGWYLVHTVRERQARYEAEEARISLLVEPEYCELRYLIPNQNDIVERVTYGGTASLYAPVELAGYTPVDAVPDNRRGNATTTGPGDPVSGTGKSRRI